MKPYQTTDFTGIDWRYNKPYKLNKPDDQIFFWSCPHYGHDPKWLVPLWKLRGFDSVQEHDLHIFNSLKALGPNATLFLLGDAAFGEQAEERMLHLFESIEFEEIFWMPGNHTAGFRQIFAKVQDPSGVYYVTPEKPLIAIPNYLEIVVNGKPAVLSHYAIASWNGQGGGSYMIHGHSHGSLMNRPLGKLLYEGRTIEVCVESQRTPISFAQVKKLLDKAPVSFDHHDSNTQNPL